MSDPSRLATLQSYRILDTAPEPQFDDIVQLARTICRTPVALVSLVAADRQWFKARAGVDDLTETPLDQSVSALAIQEPEILVIPDLAQDPRTRANTLVTKRPQIRFYAGAVLRTPGHEGTQGEALGTLCVIDTVPRPQGLSDEQRASLLALGRQTMTMLHHRRAVSAREALQQTLNEELVHRMKNTLAMVDAIAAQTLRQAADQPAVATFSRRIKALGQAHDVLLRQSMAGASIKATIEAVVGLAADLSRFAISGPDIDVNARSALSFSLLIHELVTNAVKYGALSRDGGRVSVTWRVERPADAPEKDLDLVLEWQETGGPPVVAPVRKGFGSRLIQAGLAGTGRSNVRYPTEGLCAGFRAPLAFISG